MRLNKRSVKKTMEERSSPASHNDGKERSYFKLLLIVFFIVFAASLYVLHMYEVRPYIYYFIVTALAVILLFEILFIKPTAGRIFMILTQTIALALNIIWGVTLNYYYFIGRTDIIAHAWWGENVLTSGAITQALDLYEAFPMWHILSAATYMVMGFDGPIYRIMFLISGLVMSITGILAVFAVARRLTGNSRLSLLAALFLSVYPIFMFYGMYSIPRSVEPIFLVLIIMLLLKRESKISFYLSIFLMFVITVYHTVSILFVFAIFFCIYMLQKFIKYEKKNELISLKFLVASITIALVYWAAFGNLLLWQIYQSIVQQAPTGSLTKAVMYTPLSELVNYTQYSFYLLFIFAGILIILLGKKFDPRLKLLSVMALILIPLSFPGPLLLINKLAANFDISRFDEYSMVFMSIIAAVGFGMLYENLNKYFRSALIVLFCILVVLSLSNDFVASDNPLVKRPFYTYYITQGEMAGLNTLENVSTGYLMSDYVVERLITNSPSVNMSHVLEIDLNNSTLLRNNASDVLMIRNGELAKRGIVLHIATDGIFERDPYVNLDYINRSMVYRNVSRYNQIYDSDVINAYN